MVHVMDIFPTNNYHEKKMSCLLFLNMFAWNGKWVCNLLMTSVFGMTIGFVTL
jgi:hypothetical protein